MIETTHTTTASARLRARRRVTKPTSRPRRAADDATASGCWSAPATPRRSHARFADARRRSSQPATSSSSTRRPRCPPRSTPGCPTAIPSSCTSPASCPAGVLLVEVRQPARRHAPRRASSSDPVERRSPRARPGAAPRAASRTRGGCGSRPPTFDGDAGLLDFLDAHGRPIRYRHVPRDWPIEAYQTVFAREPGSAEMPSAAPPVHDRARHRPGRAGRRHRTAPAAHRRVVARGRRTPVPRALPGPACHRRPRSTRRGTNGGRVIAVGTTVVRALATVTDDRGVVHPGRGLDRRGGHRRHAGARGRRPAHRLARAGGDPPADARGVRRRATCSRRRTPPRSTRGLPVARVRRQPPHPPRPRADGDA